MHTLKSNKYTPNWYLLLLLGRRLWDLSGEMSGIFIFSVFSIFLYFTIFYIVWNFSMWMYLHLTYKIIISLVSSCRLYLIPSEKDERKNMGL